MKLGIKHTHLPVAAPATNAERFFFWQVTMSGGGEVECLDHAWPQSAHEQREAINTKLLALTTMTGQRPEPQRRPSKATWARHRETVESVLGVALADQSPVPPLVARVNSLGLTFDLVAVDPDPDEAVVPDDGEPVGDEDGHRHDHAPVAMEPDAPYTWRVYHGHPPESPDDAGDLYCVGHGYAHTPDAQNDAVGAARRSLQRTATEGGYGFWKPTDVTDIWQHVRERHMEPAATYHPAVATVAPPDIWRVGPLPCGGYLLLLATPVTE